ncbi:GNAT family N-acetyltransferase [Paludibacterium yongneupense]|uniref:GNAT family N-acetyltransferase n=1 Tax=Paludibacterium yongneupense TaxID=400061 RepID=UPI00041840D7|nr:GNAT family N-acetyltransferase [Paludibacterium yongneupense]
MLIRLLTPSDALAYKTLRLLGLTTDPLAFHSFADEEADLPQNVLEAKLSQAPAEGVLGAFMADALVGIVGLRRSPRRKLRHKATIVGVYVAPEARGRGISRALLLAAIERARLASGIRCLQLSVYAGNQAALSLYRSLGFEAYGQEDAAFQVDGRFYDEVLLALPLRDD